MSNEIVIAGIGPGHPDFMLPPVFKEIKNCNVIYGGKRHLETFEKLGLLKGKDKVFIDKNLKEVLNRIKRDFKENKKILITVSGDPGFYSLQNFLKKKLSGLPFRTIPGISSLTYFFSKLGFSYQEAYLTSLHGRDLDLLSLTEKYPLIALLTDKEHDLSFVARKLKNKNITLFLGENLSYENEKINEFTPEEAIEIKHDPLAVILIKNNEKTI